MSLSGNMAMALLRLVKPGKGSYQDAEKMKVSQNFISQVSSDTEHLYLTKTGLYAVSPAYGPLSLVPVGAASNMAVLGGWPSGSIPYKTTLRKYGIENPYRDCVNNEKVLLIDNDINTTINYIHEYKYKYNHIQK